MSIAYSGWLYGWLAAMVFLTFAALAGLALSGLVGWVVPPFRSPPGVITIVGSSIGASYLLWLLIEMVSGRVTRGRVVLTPAGIYHRSSTFEHFAPWRAVYAVTAEDVNGPVIVARTSYTEDTLIRRTSRVGKQQEFRFLPFVAVRGRSLEGDPAVLYHALRYYHAHPEDRPELATDAGLQRIRTGTRLVF